LLVLALVTLLLAGGSGGASAAAMSLPLIRGARSLVLALAGAGRAGLARSAGCLPRLGALAAESLGRPDLSRLVREQRHELASPWAL
jgi:hypothetical protein